MRRISLRQFRDNIADIGEEVEVQRRAPDGNINVLGVWSPYLRHVPGSTPLKPLSLTEPNEVIVQSVKVVQTPQQKRDAILRRINKGG